MLDYLWIATLTTQSTIHAPTHFFRTIILIQSWRSSWTNYTKITVIWIFRKRNWWSFHWRLRRRPSFRTKGLKQAFDFYTSSDVVGHLNWFQVHNVILLHKLFTIFRIHQPQWTFFCFTIFLYHRLEVSMLNC